MNRFGIDVSRWQGKMNWDAIKRAGVQFAIIKCGGSDDGFYIDREFENNHKNATVPVGAYYFGTASNKAEAIKEAEHCVSILKGKRFDYPIFYDVESLIMAVGKDKLDEIVTAFCTHLESAGYWAGFYTSLSWYRGSMHGADLAKRFTFWLACWADEMPDVPGAQMWQKGSKYICGQNIDANYCFTDFPSLIKAAKLNGYDKPVQNPQKNTHEELEVIARQVIQGLWGAGAVRKERLRKAGYDAAAVQEIVNKMMEG